jgi:hypothetical protein
MCIRIRIRIQYSGPKPCIHNFIGAFMNTEFSANLYVFAKQIVPKFAFD